MPEPTIRSIAVVGHGEASARPDTVLLRLEVSNTASSVSKAMETTGRYVAQIGEAVRGLGLGDADVRSEGASVGPAWNEHGQVTGQHRSGHRLSLRLRSQDQVGPVLSACAHLVGNDLAVNDISLQVADPAPLRARARDKAFDDAQAIASQLAALSGTELGRVLSIAEGTSAPAPQPMMRMAYASRDLAGGVEAGENSVQVTLEVVFELV